VDWGNIETLKGEVGEIATESFEKRGNSKCDIELK